MKDIEVSVITCTRNRPDYLRRCILSVKNQTFKNYEHIIVADRCDYAKRVYEDFKKDRRIKLIESGENKNKAKDCPCPFLRNLAVEESSADFLCYCDDDNIFLPNHLSILYNSMANGFDFAYSRCYYDKIGGKDQDGCSEIILNQPDLYFLKDMSAAKNYWDCPDNLRIMTSKKLLLESGGWIKPARHTNDDLDLIERLDNCAKKIDKINTLTAIYYIKAKYRYDKSYHESLKRMSDGNIYVYNKYPNNLKCPECFFGEV